MLSYKDFPENFSSRLINWQIKFGRHNLPWQNTNDPYRIWLSEIMLQQTKVSTSIENRYNKFLDRFPNLEILSNSSIDMILAEWSGLGYYARAKNLYKCAKIIINKYGGFFPKNIEELIQLPGIGHSTAAAILVFCFGKREAILDGNVQRIFSRLLGFSGNLSTVAAKQELQKFANTILPNKKNEIKIYTQALMDFGSKICMPKTKCLDNPFLCSFSKECYAHQNISIHKFPIKNKKPILKNKHINWFICLKNHQQEVYLRKNNASGIWNEMWIFPEDLNIYIKNNVDTTYQELEKIECLLTHLRLFITPILINNIDIENKENRCWFLIKNALKIGIPKPVRNILQSLSYIKNN